MGDCALHTTFFVPRPFRKYRMEMGAIIVIAEHQMRLEGEVGEPCLQLAVGQDFAALGKIAADHHKGGITVELGDVVEAGL